MFRIAIVRSLLASAVVACAVAAYAAVAIDTVPVGNPGNAGELSGSGYGVDRICGAVAYTYKMGKYEVSNSQYCEFLNEKLPSIDDSEAGTVLISDTFGLYNRNMETQVYGGINYDPGGPTNGKFSVKSGYANRPVVYVSWYDGIRFANWLQNNQGSGSTESGTYQIDSGGKNSGTVQVPTAAERGSWTWANPRWVLPSEDEWYKAAYHKNDGATGNYWDYPTSTDAVPYSDDPASLDYPANSANYYNDDGNGGNGVNDGFAVASPPYLTDVGAYALSLSPYGTLDQGGNVWEWNEADVYGGGSSRGIRGGDWNDPPAGLVSSTRISVTPGGESNELGFRVASVPEPGSLAMLLGIALTAVLYGWRRRV